MFKRPTFVLASMLFVLCAAVNSSSLTAAKPGGGPNPSPPNWIDLNDSEGGWLDGNTGLIWGMMANDYFLLNDLPEMQGSWDYTKNTVLPAYCDATGFTDWRMATSAEVAQAAANQYYQYVLDGVPSGSCCPEITWISGGNSTWRYSGNLETGTSTRTLQARSYIPVTFVRKYVAP